VYCSGYREREGFGGGIGWYDITHGTFGGTHERLNLLNASGLAVIDSMSRVVFSGKPSADPAMPKPPPTAQLVLFDMNLNEIERQTVIPGMTDTGKLFRTKSPNILIGLSASARQFTDTTY
jgi:hypothetical protein